jgi:hypothetical protein
MHARGRYLAACFPRGGTPFLFARQAPTGLIKHIVHVSPVPADALAAQGLGCGR